MHYTTAYLTVVLALAYCTLAGAEVLSIAGRNVSLATGNGSRLQIYPPDSSAQPTDACPDAAWKTWKLHRSPSTFDPLNWTRDEWKTYLVDYPLRSASLSIAFFLLAAGALTAALTWRLVQWCVGCSPRLRHCCSVGAEDSAFLADSKHAYLKAWISLLVALGLAMVVWGMLALDDGLMAEFWEAAGHALEYGGGLADGLRGLQTNLTTSLPEQLNRTVTLVNSLVDTDRLVSYAQTGLNFTSANRALTDGLLSNASSMAAGLQGSLLPGLTALAAQLGSSLTSSGAAGAGAARHVLADAPASSGAGDSLHVLLPALSGGLPLIAGANATLSDMRAALQALQSALAPVADSSSSSLPPSSAQLAALGSALQASRPPQWDAQLGDLLDALQAYNTSRGTSAFGDVAEAVVQVVTGASSLSADSVSGVSSALQQLSSAFRSGPQQALQALQSQLARISTDVVNVSAWNVTLNAGSGGARTVTVMQLVDQVLDYAAFLGSAANSSVAMASSASGGRRRGLLQAAAAPSFSPQELANISSLVSSLNASVTSFASAALTAATLAAAGPDPSAASAAIAASLRPAVAALVGPAADLTLALTAYGNDATAAKLAALRAAAADAGAPVAAAVVALNASLPATIPLATAAGAMEGPLATLGSVASSLNATLSSGGAYPALLNGNTSLAEVQRALGLYTSLVDSLPSGASIEWTLRQAGEDITDTVTRLSGDVRRVARDASSALGSAINTLQSDVLDRGQDFVSDYQDDSQRANRITYAAWMGAWGLAALLLLSLLLGVWANWPAGLVAAILLLLAFIAASQVLCAALAFGMAALADSCGSAERLALQEVVQNTNNPKLSVVMSYYLYFRPGAQDLALQASFGLNVTDVRAQVRAANATLAQQLYRKFDVKGQLRAQLSSLDSLGGGMLNSLDRVLELALYDRVHPLYDDAKYVPCCAAGSLAYNQWCAITAMAALSLGALISAAYLLGRMDLLAARGPGCCSCCQPGCHAALDRRKMDEEAAEDAMAKEAQRQQQQYHQHQHIQRHHQHHGGSLLAMHTAPPPHAYHPHYQPHHMPGAGADAGGAAHHTNGHHGGPYAPGSAPPAASPDPAATGTAAALAVPPPPPPPAAYAAPSAPPMIK